MREHRIYHWDVRHDSFPWTVTIHAADSVACAHVGRQTPGTVSMVLSATPDYEMAKAQGRCVVVMAVPVASQMPTGDWECLGFVTLSFPQKQEQVALFFRQVSERPVVLELSRSLAAPHPGSKVGTSAASASSSSTSTAGQSRSPGKPQSSGASEPLSLPSPGAEIAQSERNTAPPVSRAGGQRGTGA